MKADTMNTNAVGSILSVTLTLFLLIGALLGIVLGLLLIFKPQLIGQLNRIANRWVSTSQVQQMLDRSTSMEQWFYQHHRVLGVLVTAGAAYIFIYFGVLFDKARALKDMSKLATPYALNWMLDTLVLVALTGATVAFIVGLFLWLRPSWLRGFEQHANQWVEIPLTAQKLDSAYDQVDQFVLHHARPIGWLLLLASLYLFFIMLRWLV